MKFNVEPDITDRENRKKIGIVRMEEWKNLTESKCSELRGRTSSGYSTAIDKIYCKTNNLKSQQITIFVPLLQKFMLNTENIHSLIESRE